MDNKELGKLGENLAEVYLINKGYNLLRKNYRQSTGEIDLIVRNKDYLVFVEVKTRRSKKYGLALEAVDHRKMEKIINTSLMYLAEEYKTPLQVRYDIIEVYVRNRFYKINHLENAFIKI